MIAVLAGVNFFSSTKESKKRQFAMSKGDTSLHAERTYCRTSIYFSSNV